MEKICSVCGNSHKSTYKHHCCKCYMSKRRLEDENYRLKDCEKAKLRQKKTWKARNLKSLYGIDENTYNDMFEKQKGCCAICGTHQSELKRSLSVDHDHTSLKVRGLLCNSCNVGLGYFKDNISFLQTAIDYLEPL